MIVFNNSNKRYCPSHLTLGEHFADLFRFCLSVCVCVCVQIPYDLGSKPSQTVILQSSVDYIEQLTHYLTQLQQEQAQLQSYISMLQSKAVGLEKAISTIKMSSDETIPEQSNASVLDAAYPAPASSTRPLVLHTSTSRAKVATLTADLFFF